MSIQSEYCMVNGGSTIRKVKVLRTLKKKKKKGRSGGAHIEGREGAACPDVFCPADDDDHVAEVDIPTRMLYPTHR